jgi:glutaredoxin
MTSRIMGLGLVLLLAIGPVRASALSAAPAPSPPRLLLPLMSWPLPPPRRASSGARGMWCLAPPPPHRRAVLRLLLASALALPLRVAQAAQKEDQDDLADAEARLAQGQRPLPRKLQQGAYLPPVITAHSSPQALALAVHLARTGAVMYGGYGCGHCWRQKQMLGREAMAALTYVECSKDGYGSQRTFCKEDKHIRSFPTWEIDGKLYEGEKSVEQLAKIAGLDLPR